MGSPIGVLKRLIAANASEAWKDRHVEAMHECDSFPRVLENCLSTFRLLEQLDEAWNAEVASGAMEYDAADEAEIAEYYRDWLTSVKGIERALDAYQKAGIPFDRAEEFRRCVVETRGMQLDDACFFYGDGFDALRDRAIESHRRGESVEMTEFGD